MNKNVTQFVRIIILHLSELLNGVPKTPFFGGKLKFDVDKNPNKFHISTKRNEPDLKK